MYTLSSNLKSLKINGFLERLISLELTTKNLKLENLSKDYGITNIYETKLEIKLLDLIKYNPSNKI